MLGPADATGQLPFTEHSVCRYFSSIFHFTLMAPYQVNTVIIPVSQTGKLSHRGVKSHGHAGCERQNCSWAESLFPQFSLVPKDRAGYICGLLTSGWWLFAQNVCQIPLSTGKKPRLDPA